jgi:hypothetical protein
LLLDDRIRPREDERLVAVVEPYDVGWAPVFAADLDDPTHLLGVPDMPSEDVKSITNPRVHDDLHSLWLRRHKDCPVAGRMKT